jgi:tRNA nucleotidyltransferase/poly(A) polymerase
MPDYMFLLESRLSTEHRAVLQSVAEIARAEALNVYLTGGAVRDLISGALIRDLDFTVEGNPARLIRELENQGARIVEEDERLRHFELLFAGNVDGSLAAARDEVYERPGTKPECRWSTIIEDLRRRDFTLNAIAISLNLASRGLLLDPTNGLADVEKREVRAFSMHSFTNQPVRLLRALRYAARMSFKLEARTAEWFALAMERRLFEAIEGEAAGRELLQLGREENPIAILKEWSKHNLLGVLHPRLAKRAPAYDSLTSLMKVRDAMVAAGFRVPLTAPVISYVLGRLKSRERASALNRLEFRSKEIERITNLESEAEKVIKVLKGRTTAAPRDAYTFLEKVPLELLAFIQTEYSQPKALSKIKSFLYKWKPLRQALPVAELEMLGIPRGPQFDKIIEEFFQLQLAGRARNPQDRLPVLRKLAGIKEPKKPKPPKEEPKEKGKGAKKVKGVSAVKHAEKTAAMVRPTDKPQIPAPPAKKPAETSPPKKSPKPAAKTKPGPPKKKKPARGKKRK